MHYNGEYEVRVDGKNRVVFPSGFLKQLQDTDKQSFMLNRGLEKCISVYTLKEWARIVEKLEGLNRYNKQNREFVRYYLRGATQVELDSANRLLLPAPLRDYAGIQDNTEVTILGGLDGFEIWNKEKLNEQFDSTPDDFAELAEKVLGDRLS